MKPINVMINGLPGNVAMNLIKYILDDERFELILYSLTGPEIEISQYQIKNKEIKLIKPDDREDIIKDIKNNNESFISIDYTHPSAVKSNVDFYCDHNLPFIMGTTGGDRELIRKRVISSSIPAIISPNMAKQIVGFQAMLDYAANTFPGLFEGFSLKVVESHQKGKIDTSGTAKNIVKYFNKLGVPFDEDQIEKIRDPEIQKNKLNIMEAYLGGHGWHTYTLVSQDKSIKFSFTHNINGRNIYVIGTIDGILYLNDKILKGEKGIVYNMIDVLKKK